MNNSNAKILMALVSLSLPAAHAGDKVGGGGHGVPNREGRIRFLDRIPEDEIRAGFGHLRPFHLLEDERTKDAAAKVHELLAGFQRAYPKLGASLIATLREMTWSFSDVPLTRVRDEATGDVTVDILKQIAYQNENGHVDVYQEDYDLLEGTIDQEFLIVHELMLAKFGLQAPRAEIRKIAQALMSGRPGSVTEAAKRMTGQFGDHVLEGLTRVSIEMDCKSPAIGFGGYAPSTVNGYLLRGNSFKIGRGSWPLNLGSICAETTFRLQFNGVPAKVFESNGRAPRFLKTELEIR